MFKKLKKSSFLILTSLIILAVAGIVFANTYLKTGINLGLPSAARGLGYWFEGSNGGVAGNDLSDFRDLFLYPERWSKARKFMDVFIFRVFLFTDPKFGVDDTFLKEKIIPPLRESGIQIALDVFGANWVQCSGSENVMFREAEVIDRIDRAGAKVSYLLMQSSLSAYGLGGKCKDYPMDKRIQDVVRYVSFMKGKYPHIKIGLIDSNVTQGREYKSVFLHLKSELAKKGLVLDFILLDQASYFLYNANYSTAQLKEVENFVKKDMGTSFGLIYSADGEGKVRSNSEFKNQVLRTYNAYFAAGGRPDFYALFSWYPYPTHYLTESDEATAPYMNTALSFGRLLQGTLQPDRSRDAKISGNFGRVREDTKAAVGWVVDENNRGDILYALFYVDGPVGQGEFLGAARADIYGAIIGPHRFNFAIPDKYKDGKKHTLYVYGGESPDEESPILLTSSPQEFTLQP